MLFWYTGVTSGHVIRQINWLTKSIIQIIFYFVNLLRQLSYETKIIISDEFQLIMVKLFLYSLINENSLKLETDIYINFMEMIGLFIVCQIIKLKFEMNAFERYMNIKVQQIIRKKSYFCWELLRRKNLVLNKSLEILSQILETDIEMNTLW